MLSYFKSNMAEWLLLCMLIFMKTAFARIDVKLLSIGTIYFHIAQYLPGFATALVTISAGILPV